METAFFWIAWGFISFWALKTFYYSFSNQKLERLRKSALGITLAVFVLTLLPWLPPSFGGKTGLNLAFEGNQLAALFVILLLTSIAMFIAKKSSLLKLAAAATLANTFIIFILMYQLRPGTFVLTLYDIAPIIAVMFLLVADVVVLLLLQQLQLMGKKGRKK